MKELDFYCFKTKLKYGTENSFKKNGTYFKTLKSIVLICAYIFSQGP